MPRVPIPTQDLPQVAPDAANPHYLSVRSGPEAFGAQVGKAAEEGAGLIGRTAMEKGAAVQGLGREVENFSNVLSRHAIKMQTDLINTDADEKFLAASIELGEVEAWHRSLEGKAALDAMPEFNKKVMAVRDKYKEQIATADGRRKFDQEFSRKVGYSVVNGGIYSADQFKNYKHNVGQAKVANETRTVADMEGTDEQVRESLENLGKEARTQAYNRRGGGSEAEAEAAADAATSNAILHHVQKLVAENRPVAAQEYLAKFGHFATLPEVRAHADTIVKGAMYDFASKQVADDVNLKFRKRDQEEPGYLDDKVAAAREQANKLKPNDPKFEELVVDKVRKDTGVSKQERRDNIEANTLVAAGATRREVQGADGGSRLLYDKSQMTPNERNAYDWLGKYAPQVQKNIDTALHNNAVFSKEWTDDMRSTYYHWAEIGNRALTGDPQAREEFLKLVPQSLSIPQTGNPGGRHALWQLQQRVLQNVPDTHVQHVMGVMNHMIKDAGLDQAAQAKLQVDLVEAVKRFQSDNQGKRPNDEQIIEMGKKMLRDEYHDKWYHWFYPGTRLFQREVPSSEKPKIIESLKRSNALRGGSPDYEPNADDIQKAYTHHLYLNEKR